MITPPIGALRSNVVGNNPVASFRGVQWPTNIENNAMIDDSDFNAIAADLVSRPMDGKPNFVHRAPANTSGPALSKTRIGIFPDSLGS